MFIGGLDVGTSGCKISIYDEKGNFICKHYEEYESVRGNDIQEIDANALWASVKNVIQAAADEVGKIAAIGVTTFGESFVMLDENDTVLLPAMLYTDKRGNAECAQFDAKTVMDIGGAQPHGMYSIPKIMWIKENLPEVYAKAKRILLFEDFIIYKLTGNAQIDYSLACRTMGFDVEKKCWSEEIFGKAGIDISLMSKPVCGGTSAGPATLPCIDGTIIVNGCHDQVAAVIGAGALEENTAVDGTGTVECITPVFKEVPKHEEFYNGKYAVVPHVLDGKYVCYAFSFTGGAALKWFRDTFAPQADYKDLDVNVKQEPTGILIMPHFAGAATPYMDENSKAVFSGITLSTTKDDLYQAIMEGVVYEMQINMERLEAAGIHIERLYATGGGANSSAWLQMKANMLGKEFVALDAPEVGAVGTVMLAGLAVGAFESLEEAAKVYVKKGKTYKPDPEKTALYRPYFEKYKLIYDSSLQWR